MQELLFDAGNGQILISFIVLFLIVLIFCIVSLLIKICINDSNILSKSLKGNKHTRRISLIVLCAIMMTSGIVIYAEESQSNSQQGSNQQQNETETYNGSYTDRNKQGTVQLFANIPGSSYEVIIPSTVDLNTKTSFDVSAKVRFFTYKNENQEDTPIEKFKIQCTDGSVSLNKTGSNNGQGELSLKLKLNDNELSSTIALKSDFTTTLKDTYSKTDIDACGTVENTDYKKIGSITLTPTSSNTDVAGAYQTTLTFTCGMEKIQNGN